MKKNALKTSLRSATHATDSARNGWIGKHRRHKRAAPQEPRHPPQHQEEQDRRRPMQQEVGEVMAACLQPV